MNETAVLPLLWGMYTKSQNICKILLGVSRTGANIEHDGA